MNDTVNNMWSFWNYFKPLYVSIISVGYRLVGFPEATWRVEIVRSQFCSYSTDMKHPENIQKNTLPRSLVHVMAFFLQQNTKLKISQHRIYITKKSLKVQLTFHLSLFTSPMPRCTYPLGAVIHKLLDRLSVAIKDKDKTEMPFRWKGRISCKDKVT